MESVNSRLQSLERVNLSEMEKDTSTNHVGASLPPSAWHSVFPSAENNVNGISEILPLPSGWHSVLPPTENNSNGISESLPPPHADSEQVKRICANRQSAARSKARKMRYISELEKKISSLQTEASSLSDELTMLQRISSGMTAENGELKVLLQSMKQQVHLQDASIEVPKEKAQLLKVTPGQANAPNMGHMMNFPATSGSNQQFNLNNNAAFDTQLIGNQFQRLNIQSHIGGSSSYQSHKDNAADLYPYIN